jgi:hypothetical protein
MNSTKESKKNLELGRGRKPKLNNQTVSMRMSPSTKAVLEDIAASYGCVYGGAAWIAGLLEKIGREELIVVPAPPPLRKLPALSADFDPKKAVKNRARTRYCEPLSENPNPGCKTADPGSIEAISQF